MGRIASFETATPARQPKATTSKIEKITKARDWCTIPNAANTEPSAMADPTEISIPPVAITQRHTQRHETYSRYLFKKVVERNPAQEIIRSHDIKNQQHQE